MKKILLLVDGSSYLYRAYHALPDLRSPSGEPTGALYGFLNMLRRLLKDYPTAYLACIFDAKGKTFRDDLYHAYKANRPAMPDDLVAQIAPIHEAVRMMGWPIIMVEGVEADDVIGTLAKQATAEDFHTIISTGDKDIAQLVNNQVSLVNTMTQETLDTNGVLQKFGVMPERIPDYLALIGDTSDNVPGVPKVGPKTAVKWLQEYGSLENVMAQAHHIKGVVGENLRKTCDWLPTARELVTIRTDCDLSVYCPKVSDSLRHMPQDTEGLKALFAHYGFNNWIRELNAEKQGDTAAIQSVEMPAPPAQTVYDMVLTWEKFEQWLDRIHAAELTAIDTETTSLDSMTAQLVGIALCVQPGEAAYIPLAHNSLDAPAQLPLPEVLARLKPWLEDPDKAKVGQNLKYDAHIFANAGICLQGIAHDTLLESYVLASHLRHDMDSLADRVLGRKTITFEEVCGKGASQISFDQVHPEKATAYAAEDADVTLQLHQALWPQIASQQKLRFIYEKIEIPASIVLQKIERNGVLIDQHLLHELAHSFGHRMEALQQEVYQSAGQSFNLNSPKQLGEILFEQLKLPVLKKTPSGTPSTNEEVLEKLAEDYPLPRMLLEYRGLTKLKSTYADKLPRMVNIHTGRVHTHFAQAVAVTGRLASSDPNLQNIPVRTGEGRRIREAFIASEGCRIMSADYSQIELRIMAHMSDDESLLRAFKNGEDIHRATAAEVFDVTPLMVTDEQRRFAKVINFGLIYGMSAFGVANNLGISRHDAQNYIDRYFHRYPGVARYMAEIREKAREQGYVETVFGRRLWLPEINSPNGQRRQGAERAAINAPMQGTAADIIKLSMIAVQDWLEKEQLASKLILQVHDELVLEVPEAEISSLQQALPILMGQVAELKVPLTVGVGLGNNWEEAH